jgi:hypothetical protein
MQEAENVRKQLDKISEAKRLLHQVKTARSLSELQSIAINRMSSYSDIHSAAEEIEGEVYSKAQKEAITLVEELVQKLTEELEQM